MNKIDSRFLDFSFIVKGTRNEPPASPNYGDQYIVGNNPTGVFEGHANNLARYYRDKGWVFIPQEDCHEVYDIYENKLLTNISLYSFQQLVYYIDYVVYGGDTLPENNNLGSYFFNTATNDFLFFNTSKNSWNSYSIGAGSCILVFDNDYNGWCVYVKEEDTFKELDYITKSSLFIVERGLILDTGRIEYSAMNNLYYLYTMRSFEGLVCLYPSDTSSTASAGKEFYTETHTLTAQEVSDKSFTLSYSVESGEETNILCSVDGVIQPASVAFEVSGDTLSWNNKTLDGLLNSGDVFVVHYVKASA